jgi:hypothetical protein
MRAEALAEVVEHEKAHRLLSRIRELCAVCASDTPIARSGASGMSPDIWYFCAPFRK